MFISKAEKENLISTINLLRDHIGLLRKEIKADIQALKDIRSVEALSHNTKEYWEALESRLERAIKPRKAYRPPPLVKTPEAPWGLKLDGTPRKRPGIPPKTTSKQS
jgi:hypothetical protein